MGTPEHMVDVVKTGRADAVAIADILHYRRTAIGEIRSVAHNAGLHVRKYGND
jgi:cyclase